MKGADDVYDMVTARGRFKRNEAMARTGMNFNIYWRTLRMLAMARFKWEGLPDTVDERYVEMTLHKDGLVVFSLDPHFQIFTALAGTPSGDRDIYNRPLSYYLNANSKINRHVKSRDCVPIWANDMHEPDNDVVTAYAARLSEIDRTIDINLANTRNPLILAVEPSEMLTAQNFQRQLVEGQPVIYTIKTNGSESIAEKVVTIPNQVHPQVVTENLAARRAIWNDAMMMLGIQAAPPGKKERMVADEANSLDGQTMAFRGMALSQREQACEKINGKYGLDVSVSWRLTDAMVEGFVGNLDVASEMEV